MSKLDDWLREATRHLARESAATVRREIRDHYESAREAAFADGHSAEEAETIAVILSATQRRRTASIGASF